MPNDLKQTAALIAALTLLPNQPASAQSRDEFRYWDVDGDGDLTCAEAREGRSGDQGLKLPAHEDGHDGTGTIYEWLELGVSSDIDGDGIACESFPNPEGYIPKSQGSDDPSGGCPAEAETWQGLRVCQEQPREGYDRDAYGRGYENLEDEIISMLPDTMKAGGMVYTPYSCIAFDIEADGTAATDIEHIVALAEAHDSWIADDRRRDIAGDLENLTIADPTVKRTEKGDRDAAGWMPARHGRWFAERVISVKLKYGLSVDPAEQDALETLLRSTAADLNCMAEDTTPPTVAIRSIARRPTSGPFPITIAFSEPVTGFEVTDLAVTNGTTSGFGGSGRHYTATITPAASGTVTVDIAAGAARDAAGNPNSRAGQFSITADLTPVPALPTLGAIALAVLLLAGSVRRRARH